MSRQRPFWFDGLRGIHLIDAILRLTEPGGIEGTCRDWTGGYSTRRGRRTYPTLTKWDGGRRRVMAVHRLIYEAAHGPLPPGEQVHHRCGRTSCVSPAHLIAVTAQDNLAEMHIRTALQRRIAVLETALAAYRPDHPALER